ncbi:hypothetical protein [Terribacillus sp. DMT04]|nr:hypothetical protein [Terribacillus sp. DMT04]QXE02587.1 hypothetical protein KS242_05235 [Terribacillus sp. DMT04]
MIYLLGIIAVACIIGCFAIWMKMVKQDEQKFANEAEKLTQSYKQAN